MGYSPIEVMIYMSLNTFNVPDASSVNGPTDNSLNDG